MKYQNASKEEGMYEFSFKPDPFQISGRTISLPHDLLRPVPLENLFVGQRKTRQSDIYKKGEMCLIFETAGSSYSNWGNITDLGYQNAGSDSQFRTMSFYVFSPVEL